MALGVTTNIVEARHHHLLQALVDHGFGPEVAHAVLHPLEVAHRHSAGVGQDVRHHENFLLLQNLIRQRGGGAVGGLDDDRGLDAVSVPAGDYVLDRCRHQNVALKVEHFVRAHRVAPDQARHLLRLLHVLQELGHVDTLGIVKAAVYVRDADDLVAGLVHQLSGHRPHVAEALNDHALLRTLAAQLPQGAVAGNQAAAPGGLAPPARPAQLDGFAGDDGGGGLADVHGIGVHHPGHHLLVGAQVGCGHVALRAQVGQQLGGVAAGNGLEFASAELLRVADHAALGSAKGDVDHRALPGHPTGQGADFVQRHIGGKADAALARPAHEGVLHPVADKNLDRPVVHHHWDVDRDFFGRGAEDVLEAFVQPQLGGRAVEPHPHVLVHQEFFFSSNDRHRSSSPPDQRCVVRSVPRV